MQTYVVEVHDLVRSIRRDEEHLKELEETVSQLIKDLLGDSVWIKTYCFISDLTRLIYYSTTNLLGIQTAGEEYVGLVQVSNQEHRILPSNIRRLVFVVLESFRSKTIAFLAWIIKYCSERASALGYPDFGKQLSTIETALKKVNLDQIDGLHIALFYLLGTQFYSLSKRIAGISHLSFRPQSNIQSKKLFQIVGLLSLAQTLFVIVDWVIKKASEQKARNKVHPTDEDSTEEVTPTKMVFLRRMLCNKCQVPLIVRQFSSPSDSPSEVYFSGIQPTGVPHIGNYFGFIQNWLRIQESKPNKLKLLSIVDLHAITVGFPEPDKTTASLLASGVDPKQTILFRQSDVLEHVQLFWILSSIVSIRRLQRLPQYKDKSNMYKDSYVPIGLLCYPALQASDVLLYKGTHVPVGEDQDQHINVLRDLAGSFNQRFKCNYFPIPEMILTKYPRIKSLIDPKKKMSKSDKSSWSRLNIADPFDVMEKKIMKALSDMEPTISYDLEQRPAVSNLVFIYSAFVGKPPGELVQEFSNSNQRDFKQTIVLEAEKTLGPIRREYDQLMKDPSYIERVLVSGSQQAREIAQKHLQEIKQIIGML